MFEESQTVCLIPSAGEDIEADLPSDAVGEVEVCEPLVHGADHVAADVVGEIVLFEFDSLCLRAVSSDGRHVEHPRAELNEGAALDRDVEVGDVVQHEVDQLLQLRLAQMSLERLCGERCALLERNQTVLREHVVPLGDH